MRNLIPRVVSVLLVAVCVPACGKLDFGRKPAPPGPAGANRPLPQDEATRERVRARKTAHALAATRAVFDKSDRAAAPWADKARAAMDAYATRAARIGTNTTGGFEDEAFVAAVGAAVDAKADDPLVVWWRVRHTGPIRGERLWRPGAREWYGIDECRAIVRGLPTCGYPAAVRARLAADAWTELKDRQFNNAATAEEVAAAEAAWWQAAGEAGRSADPDDRKLLYAAVRDTLLAYAWKRSVDDGGEKMWKELAAGLEKAGVNEWVRATVDGEFLTRHAWRARGGGFAQTVTADRFDAFHERLARAKARLEDAWAADPSLPEPAAMMVQVLMGLGSGRDEMEEWFGRAMTADPDCFDAAYYKMNWLQPKWHGSPDDVQAFADQCLATNNTFARLPLAVPLGMEWLAATQRGGAGFPGPARGDGLHQLRQQPYWTRLKAAYDAQLAADPDDRAVRTRFARHAVRAAMFPEAAAQFDLLGDRPAGEVYGGSKGAWEADRKMADERR